MSEIPCNHEATKFASHMLGYAQALQQVGTEPAKTVGLVLEEMQRLVELDYARGRTLKHYEGIVRKYIGFVEDVAQGKVGDAKKAADDFLASMY